MSLGCQLCQAMDGEPEREDVEVSVSFYELYKDRHRILGGSFQWRHVGNLGKDVWYGYPLVSLEMLVSIGNFCTTR